MLMENKTYALEVYNALNHTNYTDPETVEVVELDKGVSLSMRNDASFIVDMSINFTSISPPTIHTCLTKLALHGEYIGELAEEE